MYKVKIKSETGWSGIISVKLVRLKKIEGTILKLKSDSPFVLTGGPARKSYRITDGTANAMNTMSVDKIQELIVDGKKIIDGGKFITDELF